MRSSKLGLNLLILYVCWSFLDFPFILDGLEAIGLVFFEFLVIPNLIVLRGNEEWYELLDFPLMRRTPGWRVEYKHPVAT